jgi:hypothetical protein
MFPRRMGLLIGEKPIRVSFNAHALAVFSPLFPSSAKARRSSGSMAAGLRSQS